MYCKECGNQLENASASVCLNCGVKAGRGNNHCDGCGEHKKNPNQDICLKCGKEFKNSITGASQKKKVPALLLSLFLGGFGAHHFYAGNTGKAITLLVLTLCGFITCGITSIVSVVIQIIDIIKICTDKFKDGEGNVIDQWS